MTTHHRQRRGGVIRSKHKHSDYLAKDIFHSERLAGASASTFYNQDNLPSEYFCFDPVFEQETKKDLKIGGNMVYDQGSSFMCVAYVGCTIREKQVFNELMQKSNNDIAASKRTFSKEYLYDMKSNVNTEGMSGSNLMEIILNHGCVEDADYNKYKRLCNSISDLYDRKSYSTDTQTIDDQIFQLEDEKKHLIYQFKNHIPRDIYARVEDADVLKKSLYYNGPCLIILPFYNETTSIDFWKPPSGKAINSMGHAVTVVGYSDKQQAFYLRNSWGCFWNGTGHVWFPYSALHLAWEMWTIFPQGTDLTYHRDRVSQENALSYTAGASIANETKQNETSKAQSSAAKKSDKPKRDNKDEKDKKDKKDKKRTKEKNLNKIINNVLQKIPQFSQVCN